MGWRGRLISEAKGCGGHVIYRLAQAEQPLLGMIGLHARTAHGICRGLVEKWLVMGETFWPWLCPDGKVNSAAVGHVMVCHISTGVLTGSVAFQRGDQAFSADYFRFCGLTEGPWQQFTTSVASNLFTQIGDLICRLPDNDVASFSLWMYNCNGSSGHNVGIRITDRGTVHFYDPNLGEVAFDSRIGFKNWMEKAFAKVKGYAAYTNTKYTMLKKTAEIN